MLASYFFYVILSIVMYYIWYAIILYLCINFLILIFIIYRRIIKLDKTNWPRCIDKLKKFEIIHPFEIILDVWHYAICGYVNKNHVISMVILISISPLINIVILISFTFFLFLLAKTVEKILNGVLFRENTVLFPDLYEKNFNLITLSVNIIKIYVFKYIYIILSRDKLKIEFKKALNLFILSRIYGKSLMIINIYINIYIEIIDSINSKNYIKKKIFAYPIIFYYEFKKRIRYKVKIVHDTSIGACSGKMIYIENGKIRLNPSTITKWLLDKNPNYINMTLINLIKKMNINPLDVKYVSKVNDKFVSVKLKNIYHLCEFICDIDEKNVLLRSYSTKNVIHPKLGLFSNIKGMPIVSRYYEDDIYTQEKQEKYYYNIIVNKSELKDIKNSKILDYYMHNNINSIVFLDLQGKIRTYKELMNNELKAVYHNNENPTSISKINMEIDSTKEVEKVINELIEEIILPNRNHLTSEQVSIAKDEIKKILIDEIISMPTVEFQNKCIDLYNFTGVGKDSASEIYIKINEFKKL